MTGFPDWLVPVNISRQELAEITNRPKYGGAQTADLTKGILAGVTETLVSLSALGKTYGGHLSVLSVSDSAGDLILIAVDGVDVLQVSFTSLFELTVIHENMFHVRLVTYDPVNLIYVVSIIADLTFESSFQIRYKNQHADTVITMGSLLYTVI